MFRNLALAASLLFLPLSIMSANPVRLDPEASNFKVDVKATGHSFEVLLDTYEASIAVSPTGELEKADFGFACAALKSDNKKRDKKMLQWLESDSIPKIHFHLKDIQERDSGLVGLGDLSLHGVSHAVEVPFTLEVQGERVSLEGTATVDYTDHDLEVITMFFMKVNPELKVSFTLGGTLES